MSVLLKPELEQFIDEQVKAGRFGSRIEALEAGVARLMLDPPLDELDDQDLADIEEAERQIERGEDRPWSEVSAELRKKYLGG